MVSADAHISYKTRTIRVWRSDTHIGIECKLLRESGDTIEVVERTPEQHSQLGPVVEHFRRVLGGDLVTERGVLQRHDHRIEDE